MNGFIEAIISVELFQLKKIMKIPYTDTKNISSKYRSPGNNINEASINGKGKNPKKWRGRTNIPFQFENIFSINKA